MAVSSGRPVQRFTAPEKVKELRHPAWSPDGRFLACGGATSVVVWEVDSGDATVVSAGPPEAVALAWSPNSGFLAVALRSGGAVVIHDIRRGREVDFIAGGGAVRSLSWPDRTLFLGRTSGSVDEWDPSTSSIVRSLTGPGSSESHDLACAPDGRWMASTGFNTPVRIWDLASSGRWVAGRERRWAAFDGRFNSVAWSSTDVLAAGDDEGVVVVAAGDAVRRLEGHTREIESVRFSADGSLLVSRQVGNGPILVRDVASGEITSRVWSDSDDREARAWRLEHSIATHPSEPLLAAVDTTGDAVEIWPLAASASDALRPADAVTYTTARVVLVGDKGVGKTGLGWRLAHGEFKEHPSTHGQQFWIVDDLATTRADGARCEVVLWDLAGQADYRLVHSLFLDTVDVALLVFDPTNRGRPLAGVDYWLRRLRAGTGDAPAVVLVAARSDVGTATLTDAELAAWCTQHGLTGGFLATSAKRGDGLAELGARIGALIPWDRMTTTVTTGTFKRVRDHVLELKERVGAAELLVPATELRTQLEADDPAWRFTDAEMLTAVRHLETHGYVRTLRDTSGAQYVLLAPEVLAGLASSIVLEARREAHGLGALDEARLLDGDYRLPELDGLGEVERRVLLDAVVLLFVEKNLCFRETVGASVLLAFPSLINEKRPRLTDDPTVDDVSYVATGDVEHLYPALVVLLGYTNTFTRTHQWQNQAQYTLGEGEVCGFRQVDQGQGVVELVLYYGAATPPHVRLLFQGLFENFLARRAVEVIRHRPVHCPSCREAVDRPTVAKHGERGFTFCTGCGARIVLNGPEPLGAVAGDAVQIQAQKRVAAQRTAFESALVTVKSLLLERDTTPRPSCFMSYAWGDDDRWVRRLATDLRHAEVDVVLDRWDSRPGSDLGRYLDRVAGCGFVVVVGTPALRRKYEAEDADAVVGRELELINLRLRQPGRYGRTVLPVLRDGDAHAALPPQLQTLVSLDFRDDELYFAQLLDLIWQLHGLPADSPVFEELRSAAAAGR